MRGYLRAWRGQSQVGGRGWWLPLLPAGLFIVAVVLYWPAIALYDWIRGGWDNRPW